MGGAAALGTGALGAYIAVIASVLGKEDEKEPSPKEPAQIPAK